MNTLPALFASSALAVTAAMTAQGASAQNGPDIAFHQKSESCLQAAMSQAIAGATVTNDGLFPYAVFTKDGNSRMIYSIATNYYSPRSVMVSAFHQALDAPEALLSSYIINLHIAEDGSITTIEESGAGIRSIAPSPAETAARQLADGYTACMQPS